MRTIFFQVKQIIYNIDSRGTQAERDECNQEVKQDRPAGAFVRCKRGHKDQQIFDPMIGPKRSRQRAEAISPGREYFCDFAQTLRLRQDTLAGVDDDRFFAEFPDRKIRAGISGIREAGIKLPI